MLLMITDGYSYHAGGDHSYRLQTATTVLMGRMGTAKLIIITATAAADGYSYAGG